MMNASAPTTPAPPPPSRPRARLRRLTINIPEAVFRQLEDERASCATAARPNPTITEVVCAKLARPLHPDARASRGL